MERDTGEGVCVHSDTWGPRHEATTLLFQRIAKDVLTRSVLSTFAEPTLADRYATLDVYEVSWRVRAKSCALVAGRPRSPRVLVPPFLRHWRIRRPALSSGHYYNTPISADRSPFWVKSQESLFPHGFAGPNNFLMIGP